jgi:restriction system protein
LVGGTGDGGVDGVIDEDILGLDRIYVQAKRYAEGNNVGASAIREFFGSLDIFKASKGLFVTTSTYTDAARKVAARADASEGIRQGLDDAKKRKASAD